MASYRIDDGALGVLEDGGDDPPPAKHCHFPYHMTATCRWCGRQWFRRKVMQVAGFRIPWGVYTAVCINCPSMGDPPGSLWCLLDADEIAVLPESIVRRELLLQLDYAEKYLEQELVSV